MTESDLETRVEQLTRDLRRLASELPQVAAEHPDSARGREFSAAARVLAEGVLGRLDGALANPSAGPARRLHHCYVVDRDLDSPEGELAGRVVDGCRALQASRVLGDGGFVDTYNFEKKLNGFRWRALVAAGGRGEHAGTDLLAQLDRFEALAAAVLGADVAFRERSNGPAARARLTAAAQAMTAEIQALTV